MLGKAGLLVTVNRTCLDSSFMACLCSFKALVRGILFRCCNFFFFFLSALCTLVLLNICVRRSCPWSRFGVKEALGCRVSTFLCDMCDLKSNVNIGVYV